MEMIKVMLINNNPSKYFPAFLPPTLTQRGTKPYNRMGKLLDIIEREGVKNCLYLYESNKWDKIKASKDIIYTVSGFKGSYFYNNPVDDTITELKFVSFYPDKDWEIVEEWEGREFVRYYGTDEDYSLIDETLLYADGVDKLGENKDNLTFERFI